MAEKAWEVSTYQEQDKPDMLAIIREEYGEVDRTQEAYFDWLRSKSPLDLPSRVAREKATGRAISSGSSVTAQAVWRGQELPMMMGFDIVVAKAYRRQGIHTALSAQRRNDVKNSPYRFVTVFPNQNSMPALLKSPMHHLVSRVPLLIRPLNIGVLSEVHVDSSWLRWGINLGWGIAGRTLWREARRPGGDDGIEVVEDLDLDESYDRFWDKIKNKYEVMLVRNRAYLQWRFLDIPTREYHVLSARQGGEMLGYVVLREADVRGTKAGLIADLLVVSGQAGDQAGAHLMYEALQRFRRAGLPLTGGLMLPHTHEYAIMRRAGYLNAPDRFAPQPFHLFVRPIADEPPVSVLSRATSWYVSIADHDAV
jgi:predicted N-acetyltransferase YhbS